MQRYPGENAVCRFIEKVIEWVEYCKKSAVKIALIIAKKKNTLKKYSSWVKKTKDIFKKLINEIYEIYPKKDIRETYYSHIIGKYSGSTHQICYANDRLTRKRSSIFNIIRGYDSHHLIKGIG